MIDPTNTTQSASSTVQAAQAAARPGRSRSRPARNLALVLLCVALIGATAVAAGYGAKLLRMGETIVETLFQPLAVVLLAALALEYVILKSADRTRLLQIELGKLREKRQREVAAMRRTREGLEDIQRLSDASQIDSAQLSEQVTRLIDTLRPPEAQLLEGENQSKRDG